MSISLLERRRTNDHSEAALRRMLNEDQRDALDVLERFGWSLKFVRRTPDRQLMAWVYDPDHRRLAVIEPDGRLNETPDASTRH